MAHDVINAHGPTATVVCSNCDALVSGEFCPQCGQERLHDDHLSLSHAWHHVAHELLHWDGRILNTARLLFTRPGQLTLDYIAGRRQRHVNPLRVFLLIGAIYFVGEAAPYSEELIMSPPMRSVRATLSEAELHHVLELAHIVFKSAFIASVLVSGAVLWVLFRRRYPYLVVHLVAALHLACVWMPILLVTGVLGRALHREPMFSGFASMAIIIFSQFALRRIYGIDDRRSGLKLGAGMLAIFFTSLFLPVLATLGLLVWAAR